MPHDNTLRLPLDDKNCDVFEHLYLTHFTRVRSFLRIYLGNAAAVEDLAQDTFLQLAPEGDRGFLGTTPIQSR